MAGCQGGFLPVNGCVCVCGCCAGGMFDFGGGSWLSVVCENSGQ